MLYFDAMSDAVIAGAQDCAILEFDKIVNATLALCASTMGREWIARRRPTADLRLLDRRRDELAEMLTVLRSGTFPSLGLPDLRPSLEKAAREGSFLDAPEFLIVLEFLTGIDTLLRFTKVSNVACPHLEEYFENLSAAYPLRSALQHAITPEGDVADNASPELARIRGEKRRVRDRIVGRLERLLASRVSDPSRTDDIITLRNDRFVIPMREGDPAANDGIIQDRSGSGATLFVEPMGVVEHNNALRRLDMEEGREVERILRELSDILRAHRDALADDVDAIGALDAIAALARLCLKIDGVVAERRDEASLRLVDARHPLLVLKSLSLHPDQRFPIVPMTVELGDHHTTIIITGPNTGGKTVALKSIGLLTLMAQAGWPVPAREGTTLGVFDCVIADIGDEQSIESSLSTFSSHLSRIGDALHRATSHTLVLLDELGAGTDPKEGAALGESIVSTLTERGTRLVVTTHHTALKTLAQHDARIENASLLFDSKTLSPSYEFRVGLPGASYAIDIARRLGLPEDVVARASSLLGEQEKDLSAMLKELDERLESLRKRESEAERHRMSASELEEFYRGQMKKFEAKESERKKEALAEAERIVTGTRREMERLVREIRESQADAQRVKAAHKEISERLSEISRTKEEMIALPPEPATGPLAIGDTVWIDVFEQEGELADIDDGRGKVKVRVRNFLYNLDRSAIRKVQSAAAAPAKPRMTVPALFPPDVGGELSLRGYTVDEALQRLDHYLDDARLAGLTEVRIVHGRGEGILRRAVGDYLGRDARVAARRSGHWNEGADGVTITTLHPL